jgi:hypothetical protein
MAASNAEDPRPPFVASLPGWWLVRTVAPVAFGDPLHLLDDLPGVFGRVLFGVDAAPVQRVEDDKCRFEFGGVFGEGAGGGGVVEVDGAPDPVDVVEVGAVVVVFFPGDDPPSNAGDTLGDDVKDTAGLDVASMEGDAGGEGEGEVDGPERFRHSGSAVEAGDAAFRE